MPSKSYMCPICSQIWKKDQNSIQCNECLNWIHAYPKPCSLLSKDEFKEISNSDKSWQCPQCCAKMFPFNNLNQNELYLENLKSKFISSNDLYIIPEDEHLNDFFTECNKLTLNLNDESNNIHELGNVINSNYHSINSINQIKPDPSSSFGFIHTNLASINLHFEDLQLILSQLKFDFHVIGITEHKIQKDNPPTTQIELADYHDFDYDYTETTHGGTGFFVKKSITYNRRNDLSFNSKGNFESTFIELIFENKRNMIVGCIYRHPSSTITIKQFTEECIEPLLDKISSEKKMCTLVGDFNIDLLKSNSNNDINSFYNSMTSHFFTPYILQPTRPISKSLIDNILINSIEYPSHSGNLTIQISDHLIQFVILEGFLKYTPPRKINIYERNFKNFNEREFEETLKDLNWNKIIKTEDKDPNKSMDNFYQQINYLLDEFAPYKKITKKQFRLKSKPWINNEILIKINQRDKLFHKYCKEKNNNKRIELYNEYKLIRNIITKLKRNSKIEFYKNYFHTNTNKLSAVWKGIREIVNLNTKTRKDIKIIDVNGDNITDPKKIAEHFNKYFTNVGPSIDKKIKQSKYDFHHYLNKVKTEKTFFISPTEPQEVFNFIHSLDINKTLGPNSIPVYILKVFNHFFSENLAKIINISFETGIFPDLCKVAKVIPIYKKENPLLCSNYRPISLLPIFSKIFEKVIYKRMFCYLTKNNLIYKRQFGFRENHSTNHALISITESIKADIDKGNIVGGIFLDLQKAFDTVNHTILCSKLSYYGFRGKINDLIQSFLSHRHQYVTINGFDSSQLEIKCGVPQGSTLGPLLFLLYINDLRYSLQKSTASHFADDTSITFSSKKLKTLETILNTDLKSISDWLKANRLSLNVDKSKLLIFRSKQRKLDLNYISIKMEGSRLIPCENVKYLGLYLDKNLSWDFHVNQLSKKLSRTNGILSKIRHFVSMKILISIYYSIFYSHILYGCSVWSMTTKTNLDIITVLQKKCIRIINHAPFNSHTNELFIKNELVKLEDIIKIEHLKLVFDFKNKNLPNDLQNLFQYNNEIHTHVTRNVKNEGLYVPQINTSSYGINSIRYCAPVIWNTLVKYNNEVNNVKTTSMFKFYLKKYYLSLYKN